MADAAERRMTVDEFLEWDDGTDTRYELVDGRPVATAPPTEMHGTLLVRVGSLLERGLRRPCRVVGQAGVRRPDRNDRFFVADVIVTCAPTDRTRRWTEDPVLICEILSPSTEDFDLGRKVEEYRQIPSVAEILLVSSERRRVTHWRRDGARWVVQDFIGDAAVPLSVAPDTALRLEELYSGTDL